ncbi:hypothetical protein N180_06735 [Pedobacter antarcticus 4BY]|uniref:Uncharacterized protein n=1 Tax=Pedobacter antarcticus 4BY TaxID=1358423 RepID=A0A081PHP8_9SPHI|nr:hypothetical protein [Pedobacter antarcticus]KEQ30221.1 hypothetical protein N180_06735 [Pedobacter antarcticus 4BY]
MAKMTPNQAAFFCFFSLVAVWKEKKSAKTTKGITNIPLENVATCLLKCKVLDMRGCHFDKMVAPLRCKKTALTIGRECLFAARLFVSGDF